MSAKSNVICNIFYVFIIVCILLGILWAADSHVKSIARTEYSYSNFSSARDYEKRLIEEFYVFLPEMISEGKWFDVKLESSFGGNFTVVKKVDEFFDIELDIECYSGGLLVHEEFVWLVNDSAHSYQSYAGKEYVLENIIYKNYFDYSEEQFTQIVDEVKVTIYYAHTKEVHILKSNLQKEDELFELKLKSFYENLDAHYGESIESQIADHVNTLMLTDFDKWYAFAEQLKNNYDENVMCFETRLVKFFGSSLLTLKVDANKRLSEDQIRKYESISEWYSNMIEMR